MKLPPGHVAGKGLVRPTGYGGYGEKMLQSMGWEKGQGLGRSSQGIKEAIQVKEKQDTTGVGGRSSWKWDDNWWERAFTASSASLNKLANSSSSTSDSSDVDPSSSSSDSSSEEECSAVQSSSQQNRDGTVSSASAQELALLTALTEAGSSRMAAGRFGGRAGKMARIRAQEEAAAAAAATALGLNQVAVTSQSAANGSSSTKNKQGTSAATAIVIEVEGPSEPVVSPGWTPTPAKGWWGASTFAPAGMLEGMRKQEKEKKKGFTEDDQECVYKAVQGGKTQGRVGLGQSRRTVKVEGQAWSGTKMTFADDEEEEGGTTESEKRSIDVLEGEEVKGSLLQSSSTWTTSIKWKTVTSRFLMDTPGRKSSLKKVQRHVLQLVHERLETKGLGVPADDEIMQILQDKLVSSRQFILKGKKVRLAN